MSSTLVAYVDGVAVTVEAGLSLLEACDAAGRYVPRLCYHPAAAHGCQDDGTCPACGLCLVRTGDGSTVQACSTEVSDGVVVSTDDPDLQRSRAERLADILARHPHVCLSCPDRQGCNRDQCVQGNPPEARCCDELGHCELGEVVASIDPQVLVPRRAISVSRSATLEGRIRREPGLCLGCGRCVRVCSTRPDAGDALEMERVARAARPKQATLRDSGCTFCGLCVLVCPTGALTAPGSAGAMWLAARRERHGLAESVRPPAERRLKMPEDAQALPSEAGVLTLLGASGAVLRIGGVADLSRGLAQMVDELGGQEVSWFRFEVEPLYTQRETELLAQYVRVHGQLPLGNDLGEDLFDDELD